MRTPFHSTVHNSHITTVYGRLPTLFDDVVAVYAAWCQPKFHIARKARSRNAHGLGTIVLYTQSVQSARVRCFICAAAAAVSKNPVTEISFLAEIVIC